MMILLCVFFQCAHINCTRIHLCSLPILRMCNDWSRSYYPAHFTISPKVKSRFGHMNEQYPQRYCIISSKQILVRKWTVNWCAAKLWVSLWMNVYSNYNILCAVINSVVTTIELSPPPRWLATIEPPPPLRCCTVFSAVFSAPFHNSFHILEWAPLIVVPVTHYTTCNQIQWVNQTITMPRTRDYYCAYADERWAAQQVSSYPGSSRRPSCDWEKLRSQRCQAKFSSHRCWVWVEASPPDDCNRILPLQQHCRQ